MILTIFHLAALDGPRCLQVEPVPDAAVDGEVAAYHLRVRQAAAPAWRAIYEIMQPAAVAELPVALEIHLVLDANGELESITFPAPEGPEPTKDRASPETQP